MDTLVYSITNEQSDTLYINLTNRCTNYCKFCIRNQKNDVCGHDMKISKEYELDDIISQFNKFPVPKNIVFCGYGEPTLELSLLKEFAAYIKTKFPDITTRINTNGHANFIYHRDITLELKNHIDEMSVSLNADNSDEYDFISQPKIPNAFEEVKKFIQACVNSGIKTTATIVTGYNKAHNPDIEKCKKLAEDLGAELKIREYIPNGY